MTSEPVTLTKRQSEAYRAALHCIKRDGDYTAENAVFEELGRWAGMRRVMLNLEAKGLIRLGDWLTTSAATRFGRSGWAMTSLRDTLEEAMRAKISDAYYDARNAGTTMEDAADKASVAAAAAAGAWYREHLLADNAVEAGAATSSTGREVQPSYRARCREVIAAALDSVEGHDHMSRERTIIGWCFAIYCGRRSWSWGPAWGFEYESRGPSTLYAVSLRRRVVHEVVG